MNSDPFLILDIAERARPPPEPRLPARHPAPWDGECDAGSLHPAGSPFPALVEKILTDPQWRSGYHAATDALTAIEEAAAREDS
ncbi:MAG: hypothetical protein LC118_09100 [Dehalococcoidia bacterium]|nr:hypothetical protein [Dehalococcoidia bacterium]